MSDQIIKSFQEINNLINESILRKVEHEERKARADADLAELNLQFVRDKLRDASKGVQLS